MGDKRIEYFKRSQKKQIEKFLSPESIKKRKEKQLLYAQRVRDKQIQKQFSKEYKPKKSLNKFSDKMKRMHEQDSIFYEEIWEERPHYCENCGRFLGSTFKDRSGKIIVYRYAHIIPKSVYPYLRHYKDNIMLLCLKCHTQFDNSPKEILQKMKCYSEEKINSLKELHKQLEENKNTEYK